MVESTERERSKFRQGYEVFFGRLAHRLSAVTQLVKPVQEVRGRVGARDRLILDLDQDRRTMPANQTAGPPKRFVLGSLDIDLDRIDPVQSDAPGPSIEVHDFHLK